MLLYTDGRVPEAPPANACPARAHSLTAAPNAPITLAMVRNARSACVLVVDDEPELRVMMKSVLTSAGYVVLEATDGREAMQVVAEARRPIDLIVTDIVMPWMGGEELIAALRKVGHRLPIVCTSGLVQNASELSDARFPPDALLSKPFTPRQLLAVVETVLPKPN